MTRRHKARSPTLEESWKHLGRSFDAERRRGLDGVLARARRAAADLPADAALLAVLVDHELELERVLARLSWLETDAGHAPEGGRRAVDDIPTGWRRLADPEEETAEDDPDEEHELLAPAVQ